MENKLTWVELKKAVARQTDLTEKEVNTILTIWLDEMAAALKRGEELHISGLGTFKMKTMKARKSVDVTTGQAIVLPESDRLTFTMAAALEQEMSDIAPARLAVGIDPIQKLSEQADEILDILGEMGVGSKAPKKEIESAEPDEPTEPVEPAEPIQPAEPAQPAESAPPAPPAKKERLWLTAGITVVAFLVVLIGLFFFFQHKMEQWLLNLSERVEVVETPENPETLETLENLDTLENLENLETPDTPDSLKVPNYREYTDFIAEEQMHKDSRLAWMAYRYYGNKKLWVFIYDANKDHIANPENIRVGTPIRIPKLSQQILDYGEDIQALVEQMYDEFIHR